MLSAALKSVSIWIKILFPSARLPSGKIGYLPGVAALMLAGVTLITRGVWQWMAGCSLLASENIFRTNFVSDSNRIMDSVSFLF